MARGTHRQLTAAGKRIARMRVPTDTATDYPPDPVDFIRDELHGALTDAQRAIAQSVRDNRQVVVRSCNGAGKDWLAARLALWWVYACGGTVLITGPTERQVKEVVMGEVRKAMRRRRLPGELYEMTLRTPHHGQIIAFTSNDVSRLTGFHADRLMVILTEAQGCEPDTWEAMHACATGADSKLLAVGNPLTLSGPFYAACQSARWVRHRLSAFDHPNLVEQREVIPGAVTQAFVDSIAGEYGVGSGVYAARVLGEFPTDDAESLVHRSWLEAAATPERHAALERETRERPYVGGLDPARFGADHTALAIRQGPVLRHLTTWQQADTMQTCGRLSVELERLKLKPRQEDWYITQHVGAFHMPVTIHHPAHVSIIVDEVGLGSGVLDRLKELRYDVKGFNGGRLPVPGQESKYLNARAESYWQLRRLLETGRIALPRHDRLFDELVAMRWKVSSSGKLQIESKDDFRARVGRSPDVADAVSMAFYETRGVWKQSQFYLS